jgi:hypothetical protein
MTLPPKDAVALELKNTASIKNIVFVYLKKGSIVRSICFSKTLNSNQSVVTEFSQGARNKFRAKPQIIGGSVCGYLANLDFNRSQR